jgi:hypothetical protein
VTETTDSAEAREASATTRRWRPWRWLIAGTAIVLLTIAAIPLKVAHDCAGVLSAAKAAGGMLNVVDTRYENPCWGLWPSEARLAVKRYLPDSVQCLDRWQSQFFFFDQTAAIDDDWLVNRNFAALPCEVRIRIRHPRVGDGGIRSLSGITRLESLFVPQTSLSDDGLKAFAGHPHLIHVSLHDTDVTAASLPVLASLPKLRVLVVSSTDIPGDELHQLRACRGLSYLVLDAVQLTEPFLSSLSTFPKLTGLIVVGPTARPITSVPGTTVAVQSDAVVDDALLQRILKETTITRLWIEDGSAITDASVPALLKAGHIDKLTAWNARMSFESAHQVNVVHRSWVGLTPSICLPGEATVHRDLLANAYK